MCGQDQLRVSEGLCAVSCTRSIAVLILFPHFPPPTMITCSLGSIHISRLIITAEPDTIREGKGEEG